MTTPPDTGDALRTLARLGQEFDAGEALPSIEEGGVKPTPELRRLVRLALEHDRTLSPVSLDEVALILREFIHETTCLSPSRDDGSHDCRISLRTLERGRALLTRIKERK